MTVRENTELDRVMRRGRRIFQPSFVLYYAPVRFPIKPRIVVSQKIDKRSVVRHKVKRQIRHALRGLPTQGLGVVIVATKPILDTPFVQLAGSIHRTIKGIT